MMKASRIYIPAIALIFIAAYCGSIYGEHKARKEDSRLFELMNYSSLATDVNIKLKLLKLIDDGRPSDAKIYLDKFIDLDLASLCLYDKLAKTNPIQDIFNAIAAVKKYRESHPGHKVSEAMSRSVERTFRIINPDK